MATAVILPTNSWSSATSITSTFFSCRHTTSHVLQPLDLSVFSPLKAAYRRELGNLIYRADDTPIGKRNFLRCYSKARQSGLAEKTVLAGWRATGLWPVNQAKPLMSRLLLKPLTEPPHEPDPAGRRAGSAGSAGSAAGTASSAGSGCCGYS